MRSDLQMLGNYEDGASGIGASLSLLDGMDGGGSENRVRCRGVIDKTLSSTELRPGVLEALSMAVSSYSSGGGEKDQTCNELVKWNFAVQSGNIPP